MCARLKPPTFLPLDCVSIVPQSACLNRGRDGCHAALSQGLHTRREIKKGNLRKYEDGERDAKIAERKKRIANGTATAEEKAADREYCAPTAAPRP